MKEPANAVLDDLVTILNKIRDNKVYGSVEIFFEDGEITQITQRIINKVKKTVKKPSNTIPVTRNQSKEDSLTHSLSNLE